MSSLVHRWLLLCGLTLFVFKGCNGFFVRHVQSGMCITRSNEHVLNTTSASAYYLVMTNKCLKNSGQFFYRDNKILHNTETGEALQVAFPDKMYRNRLAVCQDESTTGDRVQFLKQTAAGFLQFYQSPDTRCAEPSESYVMRTTYCDKEEQKFTFGSVTNYGDQMENVQCSPIQRMAIKTANYGDFNNNDVFDGSPSIDKECSALSNCQVKSLCGEKTSCTLTMDDTLLPSPYCRQDTSKKIYTKYTCVDSNSSSLGSIITKATKIRLSYEPNEGPIEIKDGSTPWRKVKEIHWNKNRQKMLCQHLGFKVTDANDIISDYSVKQGRNIATGSLICYSTRPSGTSCCIHLVPSKSTSNSKVTWVKCKICDNQLSLSDKNKFPPSEVFRGSGGSENYKTVRSNKGGWCASGSTPYILIDLQKEYHLTHIMVVADREQKKWSSSYTMKYSRVESLIDETTSKQIKGNLNGFQASITQLNRVYNARYIKIRSSRATDFCLRIALCGEAQKPAAVRDIRVSPSYTSAHVTWNLPSSSESSYITGLVICVNGKKCKDISRGTEINIEGLELFTQYKVEIVTRDDFSVSNDKAVSEMFSTKRGSVTNYGHTMQNVRCSSPRQYIEIKRAVYGDFNQGGVLDSSAATSAKCNALTSCQVKSHCDGKKLCQPTLDQNLLPSEYCPGAKKIYTEYACVYHPPTTITAPNIRLGSLPYRGYIQIKDGSTWRDYSERNWDVNQEKILCKHLGFKQTGEKEQNVPWRGWGTAIATGDLICYNTHPSGTSCCVRLNPSRATSNVPTPYVRCKICDTHLLSSEKRFPGSVFSGSGSDRDSRYRYARITKNGWCASSSTAYLLIDLKKEYYITRVVVMGNKGQTKWSESYVMEYSRDTSYRNSIQITGNQNGYQASTTVVNIYNVKHLKIRSTGNTVFCLRIELCGELQTPAPVDSVEITDVNQYAARVRWTIPRPEHSSYITKFIIHINGLGYQKTISRIRSQSHQSILIKRFKPNTSYKVEIQTGDDYSPKPSKKILQTFKTKTGGKICNKPLLQATRAYRDRVFYSGRGGPNYQNAKLTEGGWCPSGSTPYLSINLRKEYHLTHVVVITDKTQRSRSTYSLTYGRNESSIKKNSLIQITDNQVYQPSVNDLTRVYNARIIKIQPTAPGNFCLRIELCGELQKPAGVCHITVKPSDTWAQVRWSTCTAHSSYIIRYCIYTRQQPKWKSFGCTREYRFNISGLKPHTNYTVGIMALDDYNQSNFSKAKFKTESAAPSGTPKWVTFTKRSRDKLTISWSAPSKSSLNGVLTGYKVCYSDKSNSKNPTCFEKNADSNIAQISKLRPSTKYFVTVQAGTSVDFGPKSRETSKITNGERVNPVPTFYSSLSLYITKQASYIKGVMIIVNDTAKNRGIEEIGGNDLKPYDANTRDFYVTAYLDAKALPLTFMIGDGKEYNYGRQKYLNQPLKQDTNYVVFLRFFERWDSYYSTQWSQVVKTFAKPPAPVNLNCFSTALKKYTISWIQPRLPDQTRVLKYHGNYSSSNGTGVTLSITTEMRSVTVDVEFEKQYTFKIQVETRAGRSNITSKSWTSHSAPLKLLNATDGFIVMLRKPKREKIKTVALVILQLRSETNKPPAPENLDVENSPPSDTKANNVGFIAKEYNVAEFQNDTIEIALRKSSGNRRKKREAADVYTLKPGATYRIAQMNTDNLGNPHWSYWSDSFTFTEAINDERDGANGGGSVGVAIGASFAVIVIIVAVVILAFFFLKKRRAREHGHEDEDEEMEEVKKDKDDQEGIYLNKNDEVEEDVRPPVPVAEFAHYVSEMKENDNYEFQKEYGDLPSNTNTSWEVSKKPFNKEKNRYGNIVTYDHCRVVLSGDEKNDYINASYIDGIKENSYIATQGPTLLTLNDMWRMVWEQRSYSIVMVTSLVELFKTKCEKYWPDSGTEKYGDIEVTLLSVEEFAYYVVHTLQLKKDEEEREVRHYYFQSWPDHGVPKYPTQILAFRRHFRTHHMEQSGPIIVHCSAGVGRTGVFLAIDTILDKLEKGFINSIDVFGQVCAMRERRMYMVQTLAQYIFVHEAILESILCGTNEVDTSKVEKEIKTLAEVKESGMTGFQEKFETLCGITPKLSPEECSAGLLKANYNKNRDKEIYPAESSRVPLQSIDEVEDSDYINAVFVQGYLGRNYFIATQSPLPDTVIDFWRLVHSQKSSTIVLLNNVKDGTAFPKFWPTNIGEPTQYGSLTVQLDSEKHSDGIWTRKFTLSPDSDLSDGQAVNIFHYTKWPDHHVPTNADAVVKLTSLVENSIKNYGLGPVIVACSDGAGRTGTYIAISNLLERTKIEQAIDVFQAIKIIRGTRPQFVENAEQYEFCYTAVKAYLDGFSDYANFE